MNSTQKAKESGTTLTDVAERARDGGKAIARGAEDLSTAVKRGVEDAADAVQDRLRDVSAKARADGGTAAASVTGVLRDMRDVAQGAGEAVAAKAASTMGGMRDLAVETADSARDGLSDVGDRIAATLNRASAEVPDDALQSRLLTSVAEGLTRVSTSLRDRSVTELAEEVKGFARRHPGAFMAAAAVAGFAAARFIRSSARRHEMAEGRAETVRGSRS